MPEASPRPVELHPEKPAAAEAGARTEPTPPRRSRSTWSWLLAIALGGFAVYLVWQTAQLQSRNAVLETELSSTRAELQAYRSHLAGARDRAGSLRGQLEELEAFLARDPAAAE